MTKQYKKITTLSIGIPVYNEQATIGNVIDMLLKQKQINYKLEHLYIYCDGSTDNTVSIVNTYSKKNTTITIITSKQNRGKAYAINQLCKESTSQILILIDADVIIKDTTLLTKIIKEFDDIEVGLVSAHDKPVYSNNFFSKIVITSINIWYAIRTRPNNLNSVHNSHGALLALKKEFYKKITIPSSVISDDEFLYFACIKNKFKFKFSLSSIIYYITPSTLHDYLLQSKRFINTKYSVTSYLGLDTQKNYQIPLHDKLLGIITSYLKSPLFTILALGLQVYLRIINRINKKNYSWVRVTTTKL